MPNKRIGKENRKKTSVSLDPEVLEILSELAEKQDRSVSYLINRYVENGLRLDGLYPKNKD